MTRDELRDFSIALAILVFILLQRSCSGFGGGPSHNRFRRLHAFQVLQKRPVRLAVMLRTWMSSMAWGPARAEWLDRAAEIRVPYGSARTMRVGGNTHQVTTTSTARCAAAGQFYR
jgi:hypothetical protein